MKEVFIIDACSLIALADSILLGKSEHIGATVITADHHEFDIIEKETNLKLFWFR